MAGAGIFKRKFQFKKRFFTFIKNYYKAIFFVGFGAGIVLTILSAKAIKLSSTDKFCQSCHVHDHAVTAWKLSTHYGQYSGATVHCVQCHLPPPGGLKFLGAKAKTGFKDIWGYLFKDSAKINWEIKSQIEHAEKFVYKESCINCHSNLFPLDLPEIGSNAHLSYLNDPENTRCISCHIGVGHYNPLNLHAKNVSFGLSEEENTEFYTEPAKPQKFENFTEYIPNSSVKFDMLAIPEGIFEIGSPKNEKLRNDDEGPVRKVKVSRFFMAKIEVSWDEYLAFFQQTSSEGKSESSTAAIAAGKVDGITGATPPWGAPDQGWGKNSRPAITMTYYAANVYCQWLSKITGKKYRLPTEAEWEYASRGGSKTPYFFEGNPKKFTKEGFFNKLFGADTSTIAGYVIYAQNSNGKTGLPENIKPNPYGLVNMLGNVGEFCSDFYNPDTYSGYPVDKIIVNPKGPKSGTEHIIRGGSYKSDARYVRSASRDYTQHDEWLTTDPQIPKSIWWYSDCKHVGFRVICEADFLDE